MGEDDGEGVKDGMVSEKIQAIQKEISQFQESLAYWDSGYQLKQKVNGIVSSFDDYMENRRMEIELEIAALEKLAINIYEKEEGDY